MMGFFNNNDYGQQDLVESLIGNLPQSQARLRQLRQQQPVDRFKQAEPTPQQLAQSQHKTALQRVLRV